MRFALYTLHFTLYIRRSGCADDDDVGREGHARERVDVVQPEGLDRAARQRQRAVARLDVEPERQTNKSFLQYIPFIIPIPAL